MKTGRPCFHRAAFSLIETALALGLVGFALVGLIGAIPLAMNNGRQSIAQTRAASVAGTVFANLRTQPFDAVQLLDATGKAIDLNTRTTGDNDQTTFLAVFDEVPSAAPTDDARRLHFVGVAPAGALAYRVVLRFDNHPAGTLAPYQTAPDAPWHAQANGIEASISPQERPDEVFRFASVVANRSE